MNYPERQLIQGLITAIDSVLPGRAFYTMPPKDAAYPYIYAHDFYWEENGSKKQFIWSCEFLLEVVHKNLSSKDELLTDTEAILSLIKNSDDITVSGYNVIETNLVNTNDIQQLEDSYRLDIELIRLKIEINE